VSEAVASAQEREVVVPGISFMSANYVARELGYGVADEWGPYDAATNAAFSPLETYGERLDAVLGAIRGAGFDALDLWTGHLNWRWATPEHLRMATAALSRHGLRVVSLAGSFGVTAADLAAACRVADAVGTTLLGGMGEVLVDDRPGAESVLREHGARLAYENHPERTPAEVLAKIGDAADVLGTALDTGWYATQGYDPVRAIRELQRRLLHVHLKDVEHPGTHVTCAYGTGCANIAGCVDELVAIGYEGTISVEHHPFDADPTAACVEALALLRDRLARVEQGAA
jgi:sugar phosphate isomerase/epimerase